MLIGSAHGGFAPHHAPTSDLCTRAPKDLQDHLKGWLPDDAWYEATFSKEFQHEFPDHKKKTMAGRAEDAYKAFGEQLKTRILFGTGRQFPFLGTTAKDCLNPEHENKQCLTSSWGAESENLINHEEASMKCAVLGIVCLPWCGPGHHEGMAHDSIEAFEVVIAELVAIGTDWFLVECSPLLSSEEFDQKIKELSSTSSDGYQCHTFPFLCPTVIGRPVRRPRLWKIVHKQNSIVSDEASTDMTVAQRLHVP